MEVGQQTPQEQTKQPILLKRNSHLLIVIMVAIVLIIAVGGGVFYWKNLEINTLEAHISDLELQRMNLSKQINDITNNLNQAHLEIEANLEIERLRSTGLEVRLEDSACERRVKEDFITLAHQIENVGEVLEVSQDPRGKATLELYGETNPEPDQNQKYYYYQVKIYTQKVEPGALFLQIVCNNSNPEISYSVFISE